MALTHPLPRPGSGLWPEVGRWYCERSPSRAGCGARAQPCWQAAYKTRPWCVASERSRGGETLSRELEPELRRRRYEYDHWDAVRLAALGAEPQGVAGR